VIETNLIPEEETIPPPAALPVRRGLLYPFMLLVCGMTLISVAASMEIRWITGQPWSAALLVLDDDDEGIPPDAYEVYAYPVVAHSPSDGDTIRELMRRFAETEGKGKDFKEHDETAIAVVMSTAEAAPLMASGRLPRPGAREALAGDLVPDGSFALQDGDHTVQYEVVGRLRGTVSGFTNAYMIVDDPIVEHSITPEDNIRWGWIVPDGWDRMDELRPWIGKNDPKVGGGESRDGESGPEDTPDMEPMDPESPDIEPAERPHLLAEPELAPLSPRDLAAQDEKYAGVTVVQRQIRTPAAVFWATLAGLVLVAGAGYSMTTRLCLRAGTVPGRWLGPLFCEIGARPKLWNILHASLYLLFFYAMAGGFALPEANYQVVQYVSGIFSKSGELGYVGDAYASGDILRAALATFNNNYVMQTLAMTVLVSLFGVPLGVIKTLGSFLLAGLALSPIWVDGASGYIFHSATMAMEFEGYIIACFGVLVWTVSVYRALVRSGSRMTSFLRGVQVFVSFLFATGAYGALLAFLGVMMWTMRVLGVLAAHDARRTALTTGARVLFAAAVASGMVLAVAALYEASTLILLVRG
jgi:hypothetical protein